MKKLIFFGIFLLTLVGSVLSQTITQHPDADFSTAFPIPELRVQGYVFTSDSGAGFWDTVAYHRTSGTFYTDWQPLITERSLRYLFCLTALDTFWQSTFADTFIVGLQVAATTDGRTPVYTIWSKILTDTATVYKDFSVPDTNELYLLLPYVRSRFTISAWADSERVHTDSVAEVSHPTYWKVTEKITGVK
jgi:hypothetical protein